MPSIIYLVMQGDINGEYWPMLAFEQESLADWFATQVNDGIVRVVILVSGESANIPVTESATIPNPMTEPQTEGPST